MPLNKETQTLKAEPSNIDKKLHFFYSGVFIEHSE